MKLTNEARRSLSANRTALAGQLDVCTRLAARVKELEVAREKLVRGINHRRGTIDATKGSAVNALTGLRDQLDFVVQEVDDITSDLELAARRLRSPSQQLSAAIQFAVSPAVEDLRRKAAKAFAPFFETAGRARIMAGQCDAVTHAIRFCATLYSPSEVAGDEIGAAERLLAVAGQVLNGVNPLPKFRPCK